MDQSFFAVPDALWRRIEPLLPPEPPKPKSGRLRVPDRVAMAGILYRVRTGCQWKAIQRMFGSGSTCHLRLTQWVRAGVFATIYKERLSVRQNDAASRGLHFGRQRHGQGAKRGATQGRIRETAGDSG
jgi:transposase